MSARVVEEHYRLQAVDLARLPLPLQVQVTNVTYQGLERMSVLLYFDQLDKPLLLEQGQMHQLIRDLGGSDFRSWVGESLYLDLIVGNDNDIHEQESRIDVRASSIHIQNTTIDKINAETDRPTPAVSTAPTVDITQNILHQFDADSRPQRNSLTASALLIVFLAAISLLVYLLGQSEVLRTFFGF